MLSALRRPLHSALRTRLYATATTQATGSSPRSAPPGTAARRDAQNNINAGAQKQDEEETIDARDWRWKDKPESAAFYSLNSGYYDQLESLQRAVHSTRRALTALELLPLPDFARASLPTLTPYWRSRRDMSELFDNPLSTRNYADLIKLLRQLQSYYNIAKTAGHLQFANGLADVLHIYEHSNKDQILARGTRKLARFDKYGRTYSVGRRKTSSARVWIIPKLKADEASLADKDAGRAAPETVDHGLPMTDVIINGRPLRETFVQAAERERVLRPLRLAGVLGAYNIFAISRGGGTSGQAGAVMQAVAKGLAEHEPEMRETLRKGEYCPAPVDNGLILMLDCSQASSSRPAYGRAQEARSAQGSQEGTSPDFLLSS